MKVVIATKNEGKLREFKRILANTGFDIVSQFDVAPELEVEETGVTFAENARLKAEAIMKLTGNIAIGDDSGLCVDALGGEPGVYSARYAENDETRRRKVLNKLQSLKESERTARFICNICCVMPNGDVIETQGTCEGAIGYEQRGENGFGYDPIFIVSVNEKKLSFAEITGEQKDQISHRGNALRRFVQLFEQYLNDHSL